MTLICPLCSAKNSDDVSFCVSCGTELDPNNIAPVSSQTPQFNQQVSVVENEENIALNAHNNLPENQEVSEEINNKEQSSQSKEMIPYAKLILKSPTNQPQEFPIEEGFALIGKFDPDVDLVDIDLNKLDQDGYISRNHAEIFYENGVWQVKDLNSENGVFVRHQGDRRYTKITKPEILNYGDLIAFANLKFQFDQM